MKKKIFFPVVIMLGNLLLAQNEIQISLSGSEKVSKTYYNEAQEVDYFSYCVTKYDESLQNEKLDSYYSKTIVKEINLKDFQKGTSTKINLKIKNDSHYPIKILKSPTTLDGSLIYKMQPRALEVNASFDCEVKIEGGKLNYDFQKKGYSRKRMEIRTLNHKNEPIIYLLMVKITSEK